MVDELLAFRRQFDADDTIPAEVTRPASGHASPFIRLSPRACALC
jgi:hypothetical protein